LTPSRHEPLENPASISNGVHQGIGQPFRRIEQLIGACVYAAFRLAGAEVDYGALPEGLRPAELNNGRQVGERAKSRFGFNSIWIWLAPPNSVNRGYFTASTGGDVHLPSRSADFGQ
jgi:hypothetical protein